MRTQAPRCIQPGLHGCGSRTIAASTARTTMASHGNGLVGTGLPSGFGYPSNARTRGPRHRVRDPGEEHGVSLPARWAADAGYRTRDGGRTWESLCFRRSAARETWTAVLREGAAYEAKSRSIFGTQSGSVFALTERDTHGSRPSDTCRPSSQWRSAHGRDSYPQCPCQLRLTAVRRFEGRSENSSWRRFCALPVADLLFDSQR